MNDKNKYLYMIFIEKEKEKKHIRNYIWFYEDGYDKIKIVIGINGNNYFETEYIPKIDIYTIINDKRFIDKYSINYVDINLMNKLKVDISLINKLKIELLSN